MIVDVPVSRVHDWPSFHDVFAQTLGFADYYGRNKNAFTDILQYPQAHDVEVDVPPGGTLVLRLDEDAQHFQRRCPEQCRFLFEAAASLTEGAIQALTQPGLEGAAFVAIAFVWSD